MSAMDSLMAAREALQMAVDELPGEADLQPTIDAGEVVSACAEYAPKILAAVDRTIAALQGGEAPENLDDGEIDDGPEAGSAA